MTTNNNDDDSIKAEKANERNAAESKIPVSAWKILAILSCISIMVLYAETMLIPAIPHLIDDFSITYSTSSWILSSYLIAGAISVPVAGKLSDMYGRKRILLLILLIYTIGVIGATFSTDIHSLLISRTVQGIGMSVFPIVFAMVQSEFPRNKISIAQGTLASMFAFGGVLGLVVGGNLVEYFGWRSTFYSVIPVAILLIIVIIKRVHVKESFQGFDRLIEQRREFTYGKNERDNIDPARSNEKFTISIKQVLAKLDFKGIIFLAISVTSFLSALTLVQSQPTSSEISTIYWQVTVLASLGSASFGVFIIVEKKSASPIVDFKLISRKPILISNILVIIWGICTFAVFQTIPILVQSPVEVGGLGGNAINAANIQLPFSITSLIFGPTSGFIISRIGSPRVIVIGAMVMTCGFFAISVLTHDAVHLAITLAIIGVGLALLNVGQLNVNATSVSPTLIGTSLGINTLLRYIGSAVGPAVAGMLMQSNQTVIEINGNLSKSFPSEQSYSFIFATILALSIVAVILSGRLLHFSKRMISIS